jgi:hypothetical protein
MSPGSSQFKTTIAGALKNVEKSVSMFSKDSGKKVTDVIISSNVTLGSQRPDDAGVAVYFTWDGITTCIAVDRYSKVEDNLQAIHHCLEAERTKLRHGGLNLVRAAFRGYAALPPPGQGVQEWFNVLGVSRDASLSEIKSSYRSLASKHHPDRSTGNTEKFQEIEAAYRAAKTERGASD